MALPNLLQQPISQTYKGLLHTSNVPIKENTLAVIYDGEGNKSSMKLGKENNGVEFSGKVKATDFIIREFATIVDYLYPIGAIYLSINDINPGGRFVGTTWQKVSEGRFLVGVGTGIDNNVSPVARSFNAANNTGEYEHVLIQQEMPVHTHTGITGVVSGTTGILPLTTANGSVPTLLDGLNSVTHPGSSHTASGTGSNKQLRLDGQVFLNTTGGNQAHNNTPPSYGVYVFQRIS